MVVFPHNEMLFSNKKEENINARSDMGHLTSS